MKESIFKSLSSFFAFWRHGNIVAIMKRIAYTVINNCNFTAKGMTDVMNIVMQEYLDAILEQCQDGIYITDGEANTVYLNHSYERISGLTREEMIGKNMRDLVAAQVVSVSGTLQVLETGEKVTREQRFRTGQRALITSAPIYSPSNKNHLIMVVTIVREVTEIYSIRRELQRMKQQNLQYANELRAIQKKLDGDAEFVAEDEASKKMMMVLSQLATTDMPVLITGEAGCGKARAARYVHSHSKREMCPFVRLNFSVISGDDVNRYLFGYMDAEKQEYQMGILESANGGTVYIDELTEIPTSVRGQILSLLQNGTCHLGDGSIFKFDLRWIVASQYAYDVLAEQKKIEADILNCFAMMPIAMPPLRERKEDILPLIRHFLMRYNRENGTDYRFVPEQVELLFQETWEGNIRELEMCVQKAAVLGTGPVLTECDLLMLPKENMPIYDADWINRDGEISLKDEVAKLEAKYMITAFEKYQNTRDAAKSLGMDSSTFVRKRQKYEKKGLM